MKWVHLLGIGMGVALVGVTAGFVGGTFLDPPDAEATTLELASVMDCPMGTKLTEYRQGTRVYAVARSESGNWVQIRDLDNPASRVWVQAGVLELDTQVELPVASCEAGVFVIATEASTTTTLASTTTTLETTTTTLAGETTTSSSGQTTSSSTATTTSTTTTSSTGTTAPPPADTTPPAIGPASVLPAEIWEQDGGSISCGTNPRIAKISATVTDAGGVDSVTASWSIGGTNTTINLPGAANVYTGNFGPFPYQTISDTAPYYVNLVITIRAEDASGNQASTTRPVRLWSTAECFG